MIKRILINKSPVFSHVELFIKDGLNVISGISGSGKSVFFDSILSVFGLKEPNAELVEANLKINLKDFGLDIESMGINELDSPNEITISILKKQNTRYFLNNQSIPKKKVIEIAKHFIKHISIKDANELDSENILNTLDNLIATKEHEFKKILQDYKNIFNEYKQCKKNLLNLEEEQKNIENLKDFARFEIDKISKINPKPQEYEKLLDEKKLISKKEKILQQCRLAIDALDNLDSVQKAYELLNIDNNDFLSNIMEARNIIEDSINDLENLDDDPEAMLERISMLSDIIRRYGSEENALKQLELQKEKLKEYEDIDFNKTQLEKRFNSLNTQINNLSIDIKKKRQGYLSYFEEKLNHFAKQLKLNNLSLQLQDCEIYNLGSDNIEILLASTTKDMVSSGEYNRMRLCMLCVMAELNNNYGGILILDEIDANLSGEESEGVAKLLQFLSKTYQIFAVSHQPFMPLRGNNHYLVSKNSDNESKIELLNKKGRIKEIARMISGSNLNKDALSYAEKLLKQQE